MLDIHKHDQFGKKKKKQISMTLTLKQRKIEQYLDDNKQKMAILYF